MFAESFLLHFPGKFFTKRSPTVQTKKNTSIVFDLHHHSFSQEDNKYSEITDNTPIVSCQKKQREE